jgi:hypothetical protein
MGTANFTPKDITGLIRHNLNAIKLYSKTASMGRIRDLKIEPCYSLLANIPVA